MKKDADNIQIVVHEIDFGLGAVLCIVCSIFILSVAAYESVKIIIEAMFGGN